jgi:uncharacterized repeat protein (TIGR03803 family)
MKTNLFVRAMAGAAGLGLLLGAAVPMTAQVASTLYSFSGADGINPSYGSLAMDSSGNLYGTTTFGGANNFGTVFELVSSPAGYSERVLYSFAGGTDGVNPFAGLVMDSAGNLYGTTNGGGANNSGTVFELVYSPTGYSERVLYTFAGGNDGAFPYAGLVMDSAGNLYGTTVIGGLNNSGTVFELINSSGVYSERVLYIFTASSGDGLSPYGGLIMDPSGNLYGTTYQGGANSHGTVFELVNSSGTYSEKVLYGFGASVADGANPFSGLVMDPSGNLYGTTSFGGSNNSGTVFELINSSGTFSEKVLYSFAGSVTDGASPVGGLVLDSSGNLYGTTRSGGPKNYGAVFELINSSGTYTEVPLLIFGTSCGGTGWAPAAGLVMDPSGSLYGTTIQGGGNGFGTVFSLTHLSAPATPTVTTLSSSPNPVGAGLPVIFTANVTSSVGFPAGNVTISNSAGPAGAGPLVCGVATIPFGDALTFGLGNTVVTATYAPAVPAYSSSVAVLSQTVIETDIVLNNGNNTLTGNDTINGSVTMTGTVSASSFVGNGSGLTGVSASGLSCVGCVGNSQLAINYAGSTSQGGAANSALSATNALMLGGFMSSSFLLTSVVGQPNGVASLDATGKVPAAQLPATGGSGVPAILSGWCSGAVASSKGATFSFAGLGAAVGTAGTTCSDGTSPSTVVGIPVTSAGTLANLQIYPGKASSAGTSLTFTVYYAAAPGWTFISGPNQAAISALSLSRSSRRVTLTVATGASFTAGDQIGVSGISGAYNAGTNCTALSGALFDGTFTVSSSTATTVVYIDSSLPTNCGSNIGSAGASGAVVDNTTPTENVATKTTPTATALTCTIGAPSTSASLVCSDASHTVPVNAGDVISVVGTSARASGTETIGDIRVSLEKQ